MASPHAIRGMFPLRTWYYRFPRKDYYMASWLWEGDWWLFYSLSYAFLMLGIILFTTAWRKENVYGIYDWFVLWVGNEFIWAESEKQCHDAFVFSRETIKVGDGTTGSVVWNTDCCQNLRCRNVTMTELDTSGQSQQSSTNLKLSLFMLLCIPICNSFCHRSGLLNCFSRELHLLFSFLFCVFFFNPAW